MTDRGQAASRPGEVALAKIESHEKHCEERARRAELFEAEMRAAIADLRNGFGEGLKRLHARIDELNDRLAEHKQETARRAVFIEIFRALFMAALSAAVVYGVQQF